MSMKKLDLGYGLEWFEGSAADGVEFWSLLGPIATNVAVHKELGEPIVSTANHVWLFGLDNGVVVAASALILPHGGKPAWLAYSYVAPSHRKLGLWHTMTARRLQGAQTSGAKLVKSVSRTLSRPLSDLGFTLASQRGSWSYMEKAL